MVIWTQQAVLGAAEREDSTYACPGGWSRPSSGCLTCARLPPLQAEARLKQTKWWQRAAVLLHIFLLYFAGRWRGPGRQRLQLCARPK